MANNYMGKKENNKPKVSATLVCTIVLLLGLFNISAQLDGYDHKKKLIIDQSMVSGSSDLTNFPLLIQVTDADLKSTANGGNVESSNGYDIQFTAADSTTVLDHQIESYDPSSGELTAWVKAPTLSADSNTTLFMYYGNTSVSSSQDTTSTWSNNYLGVWHLNDNVDDQSSNSRHFTNNGSSSATGKIGNARLFNGTSSYLVDDDAENYLNGLSSFSISVWVKSNGANEDRDILFGNSAGDNRDRFLSFRYDQTGAICGGSSTIKAGLSTTNQAEYNEELDSNIQTTYWQHLVVQWQAGESLEFYINGVKESISCNSSTASGSLSNLTQLLVGVGTKNQNWDGLIDELRIGNSKRSDDWIATEYNNQNNASGYISFGGQTNTNNGGGSSGDKIDLSNYADGKRITIQNNKVCGSGDHSDFPVLIDLQKSYLKSTGNGGRVENTNGYDIVFTKADSTQLDHQIEKYDPSTGKLTAWVKLPALSADSNTQFYMFYGNSSISSSQDSDSTWSSEHLGVWHMDDVRDHSGNNRNFINIGSSSDTGKIGNARSFDGSDDYLQDADGENYLNGLASFSISVWVKSNVTNEDRGILFGNSAGDNNDRFLGFRYDQGGASCGGSSSIKGGITTTDQSEYNEELTSNTQTTDWQHIVMQWNAGGPMEFYIDGSPSGVNCSPGTAGGNLTSLTQLIVGVGAMNQHWDGFIDELQITNAKRSAGWICTQYNNQSDPAAFYALDDSAQLLNPCANMSSGNWSDSATWTGNCGLTGEVPNSEDRIDITDGNVVTVNGTQFVKRLKLMGDDKDTTTLKLEGSGKLTVTDSFIVQTSCGNKDVFISLDDSSHLDIQGGVTFNHVGGEDINIHLNQNSGDNAKMSVGGNMYMNLHAGCADDVNLKSFQDRDTVAIAGDLILENANTDSLHQINIDMQGNSVLDVNGDLDFRPSADDNVSIALNNSSELHLSGDMLRQASPNRYGSINSSSNATVLLDGSAQQQLGGNAGDSNDGFSYGKLKIDNAGGSFPQVTLDGNVSVSNELALADGNIQTGNDTISLTNTSASSLTDYGAQSHIVGYLKRHITSNTSEYVFPVGEGTPSTYYQGAIVNRNMSNVNYIVSKFVPSLQRYDVTQLNASTGEFDFTRLTDEGMWIFEPDQQPSFPGMYDVKLWIDNIDGLTDNLFGIVKRPKGAGASAWETGSCLLSNPGGPGRLKVHGYALSTMCNSFSELTVGDGDGTTQPIELMSFDAKLREDQVNLNWTTATEINNDHFTIQRSKNGQDWENIKTVDGAGNSNVQQNYHAVDENPLEDISYYRIKQTDFNGDFSHTGIETVNFKQVESGFVKVYPNPNQGIFTLEIRSSAKTMEMSLYNIKGDLFYQQQLGSSNGRYKERFDLAAKLSEGMYFIRIQPDQGKPYVEKIQVNE